MTGMTVGGAGSTQTTINTDQTNEVTNTGNTVGTGNTGQTGSTPDVQVQVYAQITISLGKFSPKLSGDKLDIFLATITADMRDKVEESEKGRATVEMEKKQSAMADKRDKLEKMQEKMDEATKKEEKKGFWGKLRNAFQAIGAALAIVAGIAMIALSGGVATPLAALMIAGGALTLLSMLDQYVAEQTGHGILANYMKGLGIQNEKFLEAVDIGSQVAFAVAGIAIGIASMMTGNPAGLSTAVLNVMKFAALATIALDVAAATTGTISAVYSYEAANASAEAKDKKAEALQIDAMMQMLDDAIDQALQQLMAGSQMAADMLDQVVQSMNDRGNTASKARFTG